MRGAATSKSRIRAVKSSQLRILLARPGGHFYAEVFAGATVSAVTAAMSLMLSSSPM